MIDEYLPLYDMTVLCDICSINQLVIHL